MKKLVSLESFEFAWISGHHDADLRTDKATSELLPSDQEDIALNLEICDQIKAKMVQPKDAMRALKRRLNHKNPNVQLLALTVRGQTPPIFMSLKLHPAHGYMCQEWWQSFPHGDILSRVYGQSCVYCQDCGE
jgi:hypothetical protein